MMHDVWMYVPMIHVAMVHVSMMHVRMMHDAWNGSCIYDAKLFGNGDTSNNYNQMNCVTLPSSREAQLTVW